MSLLLALTGGASPPVEVPAELLGQRRVLVQSAAPLAQVETRLVLAVNPAVFAVAAAPDVITIRSFAAFANTQARPQPAEQVRLLAPSAPVGRDSPIGIRSFAQFVLAQPAADAVAQTRLRVLVMSPSATSDDPPPVSALALVTMRMRSEPTRPGWVQQQSVSAMLQAQQPDVPMRSAAQIVLTQPISQEPSSVRLPPVSILALLDTRPGSPEGGASFRFVQPGRGTALFSTQRQPEPAESAPGPKTLVAESIRPAAAQPPGHNPLRHLFAPAPPARTAPGGWLEPLPAGVPLVQFDLTMLRLEIAVLDAIRRDEEDEAIAILLLSDA